MKPEELAAVDIFKHFRVLRHVTEGKLEEQTVAADPVADDAHINKLSGSANATMKVSVSL